MLDLQPELLRQCMGCSTARANTWAEPMRAALAYAGISTPRRLAHWLSQLGHESGNMQWVVELWGPTPQQRKYEPGTKLAAALGNTAPGDGFRYRGRGLIQVTGRANYRRVTRGLRARLQGVPDFEARPQDLADPHWAALSAAEFWRANKLNLHADADDALVLTKRINGGLNGYADRLTRLGRAKSTLLLEGYGL